MTKNAYIYNENNACFAVEHFIRNELMEKAIDKIVFDPIAFTFRCYMHTNTHACDGATMHADIK